jgi:PIN domain nuclease of toxin-antitoxin system
LQELEALPLLSKDPFDRMLVAQARAENMPPTHRTCSGASRAEYPLAE